VKAVTVKIVPIIRFRAQIPPLRRTYQEVPNPRALDLTVWATDLGILLPAPPIGACVYHCAAQPLDADTANRIYAANNWDRIRREIAWCRARLPFPVDVTTQSRWEPCVPSVPVADDLSIPDFLKREPAAVSEFSPEGLLVAAE